MDIASRPYHEPAITTILTQASLLLLLNWLNYVLDKALYCGLLGQILLGIAWGSPGAKLLGANFEAVTVQLGYLGLLLLVYHGGLSTPIGPLKANALLSAAVAVTGIGIPMAFSFALRPLVRATPLQCFAAGSALCSTSLGTTLKVLCTSDLIKSRLGTVLTSAAILDDIVGLVLVKVISDLGKPGQSFQVAMVARPLLTSVALIVLAPLVCVLVAKPISIRLGNQLAHHPTNLLARAIRTREFVFVVHTVILLGCVAGATFAGASSLLAAYTAGTAITWWDSNDFTPALQAEERGPAPNTTPQPMLPSSLGASPVRRDADQGDANMAQAHLEPEAAACRSGTAIYSAFYAVPVDRILIPFFFASIGFSIPISQMFSGNVVWKGFVFSILMALGKLACGIWLLPIPKIAAFRTAVKPLKHCGKEKSTTLRAENRERAIARTTETTGYATHSSIDTAHQEKIPSEVCNASHRRPTNETVTQTDSSCHAHGTYGHRSVYPAAILGCAMISRGEIGFLISSIAESNNILRPATSSTPQPAESTSDIFRIVTWAITICTLIGPPIVGLLVQRIKRLQGRAAEQGHGDRGDTLGIWGLIRAPINSD